MCKFLLLLIWSLTSFVSLRQTSTIFQDVPAITETSVGKARIGMTAINLKEAYKGYTFAPTYLVRYGFDAGGNKPDATLVSDGGQKLFVYFLDWQTKKVAGLIVLHPAYRTSKGIHVGTTSGQLRAALPAIRVGPHEFVEGIEIASAGTEENTGLQYDFYKQGHIGKNQDSVEPSGIAVTTAKVSWIMIKPN